MDDLLIRELFADLMPAEEVRTSSGVLLPSAQEDDEIMRLMLEAEDPDTGIIRDLKIDDRDLYSAKNFYDYCYNVQGRDANPPWIVQMWILIVLLAEFCPVCSNKRWLNLEWFVNKVDKRRPGAEITEGFQLLHNGKCPKCNRHKYELIKDHGLRNYTELVAVLGQRSGKSVGLAAALAGYQLHRFLKFPKLADLAPNAMQKSTELTGTFVSLTTGRAIALLWTPFLNVVNESAWFNEYFRMLDYNSNRYGYELYKRKELFLKFTHKGIRLYPTGPRGKTLRGDTRILGLIDELGLFPLPSGNDEEDEQREIANADEAHKSLTNSLVTAVSIHNQLLKQGLNCPPALMIGVSSPMSERDKVMRRLGESRTPTGEKFILGVNLPTWNVNPTIDRDSPIIEMAYASNPAKAERDFGAKPPRVSSTFMTAQQVPSHMWCVKQTHTYDYVYGAGGLSVRVSKVYTPKNPVAIFVDAGFSNNSFSLIAISFDRLSQAISVCTAIEVMPHDGFTINFAKIYDDCIRVVAKDLNAVVLMADQWQSLDLLSRAQQDAGLNPQGKHILKSKKYSPKRKDFEALRSMITNGTFKFPYLEPSVYTHTISSYTETREMNRKPAQHLLQQFVTVRDPGGTACPTKGEGFTDDLFRCLVLAVKIFEPVVLERLMDATLTTSGQSKENPKPVFIKR